METAQQTRVLNSALRKPAIKESTANPPFVSKYVKTRKKIDELELERRELEHEVIEWGQQQILSGATHNSTLPLKGSLAKSVEIALTQRKAGEKDLLKSYTELRQLAEYLQDDRATSVERNANKIAQLKSAILEMEEEIESLSYSPDGKEALSEYQSMLVKLSSVTPPTLGIRLKHLS